MVSLSVSTDIFPYFSENLPCLFLQADFHDQLAAQWSLDQNEFHCLALHISDCTEIHREKKNTAEPLFWFKMAQNKFKDSLNLSTLYSNTKPDQNQSMLWITFIPSKQSRKVAERAKYCQSALMLNAPDELLFKETMVTPFVKGVIIS